MNSRLKAIAFFIAASIFIFQLNIEHIVSGNGFHHIIGAALITLFYAFLFSNLTCGMLLALVMGIGKEIYDPVFSMLDLGMDLLGILIGAMIVEAFRFLLRRV